MKTIKHLFLDLEDTIITPVVNGWASFEVINLQKIKDLMEEFQPDAVNIFSFAIHDNHQLKLFNAHTRPFLEEVLGVCLGMVPTVDDDIIPACCSVRSIHPQMVSFSDASDFWSKHESFRLFCRSKFKTTFQHGVKTEVMLLDDMVFNEEFSWPDIFVSGKIINIS